jgi:hypothetical protein
VNEKQGQYDALTSMANELRLKLGAAKEQALEADRNLEYLKGRQVCAFVLHGNSASFVQNMCARFELSHVRVCGCVCVCVCVCAFVYLHFHPQPQLQNANHEACTISEWVAPKVNYYVPKLFSRI